MAMERLSVAKHCVAMERRSSGMNCFAKDKLSKSMRRLAMALHGGEQLGNGIAMDLLLNV